MIYICMKSIVIGDGFFVAGFLYGGFDKGIVVNDKKDIKMKINEIIDDGNVKLIVVEKLLIEEDIGFVKNIKADASKPLILEI